MNEIFKRLQANSNDSLLIGFDELRQWPEATRDALIKSGLLKPTHPANTLVCNGCEENCLMPVHVIPGTGRAFIVCDQRNDTARVPVQLDELRQWRIDQQSIIQFLCQAIDNPSIKKDQLKSKFASMPLSNIISFKEGMLFVSYVSVKR